MAAPSEAHTISVAVDRPPGPVYDYVTDPTKLPEWAAGLAKSVEHKGGQWVVDSGDGEWVVEFVAPNALGVADHKVTQPDGSTQVNPMRVLPNGDGSAVTFTLFRAELGAGADDDAWAALIATITADLQALAERLGAAG